MLLSLCSSINRVTLYNTFSWSSQRGEPLLNVWNFSGVRDTHAPQLNAVSYARRDEAATPTTNEQTIKNGRLQLLKNHQELNNVSIVALDQVTSILLSRATTCFYIIHFELLDEAS